MATALKAGAGAEIDTMIGTTREEMAAFYCIDQEIANADAGADRRRVRIGLQRATGPLRRDPPHAGVRHQCGAAGRSDDRCDVPHRQSAHGRSAGRPRAPGVCVPVRLAITGRFRILPLPRNSVRVQQFRELEGIADARRARSPRKSRGLRTRCTAPGSRLRVPDGRITRACRRGRPISARTA